MNKKSVKKLIVSAIICVTVFGATKNFALASDDDIGYSFTVYGDYGNSYSSARYRQTSNMWNQWKVNLQQSSEGDDTIMTFWLAEDEHNYIYSDTHDVKQGSGSHYYWAYDTAKQQNVKLGCENNNYTSNSYQVSGIWDEETDD